MEVEVAVEFVVASALDAEDEVDLAVVEYVVVAVEVVVASIAAVVVSMVAGFAFEFGLAVVAAVAL